MKAKYSVRGFLCPNFIIHSLFFALIIVMSNSCFNRPALAQHKPQFTKRLFIADKQMFEGQGGKTLHKFNCSKHQLNQQL